MIYLKKRFIRVRIDEELIKPSATITLEKNKKHTIEALIDKVTFLKENKRRITDSIKKSSKRGQGSGVSGSF